MATPTVLFLPGLLEDAEAFHAAIVGLSDVAAVRVADLTRADTIARMARNALDEAPAGPLHVAAHSMGGYVALEMARVAPERIAKLAFLNTHARADTPESTENRRRLMTLAARDFRAVIETLLPKLMLERHLRDPALVGIVTGMALAVGKDAFLRQQEAIIQRIDSRPHLAAITAPTLVVAARDDQLMPLAWLEELAQGISNARLAIIDDCGHLSPIERPRQVIRLLREWVTGRDEPVPEFPVEAPPPAS
jgi:pimeloyl-ACP methyl ester carboxylesterase